MDEPKESVDIEEIMREIREQIVAQKARETGNPDPIPVSGRHLSDDFYENLYQLQMSADRLTLQPEIAPSTVPLIGSLLDRFRRPLHQLVIFYVNRLAIEQTTLNSHLLRTVDLLAREVERLADARENETS